MTDLQRFVYERREHQAGGVTQLDRRRQEDRLEVFCVAGGFGDAHHLDKHMFRSDVYIITFS